MNCSVGREIEERDEVDIKSESSIPCFRWLMSSSSCTPTDVDGRAICELDIVWSGVVEEIRVGGRQS